MKRLALIAALLQAAAAQAAQFTITLTNTGANGDPAWSTGLLTLQPLIAVGLSPQPGTPQYATYRFTNSHCSVPYDTYCPSGCNDDGNATVLAQRWGLTLNVNAWLVPALAANGGRATVTIDAPAGSRLSYIAWVNDTGVFDDFVAMHPTGDTSTLSVPLFDAGGQPLTTLDYELSGYDSNSVSATDGNQGTCAQECGPSTSPPCYVAVGNATYGSGGGLPQPPPSPVTQLVALSGNARATLTWTNVGQSAGVVVVRRQGSPVSATPTNGTTYTVGDRIGSRNNPRNYVVFVSSTGATNTFTDPAGYTAPANGTKYYYKVFARNSNNVYSAGTEIWSTPTAGATGQPVWCYNVGLPMAAQPFITFGAAVYASNNANSFTANVISTDSRLNGSELWRPTALNGIVQSRSTVVALYGGTQKYVLIGDFAGYAYKINATTGEIAWVGNGGAPIGTRINAQAGVQLYQSSNAAFQARWGTQDLVYFATRNSSTTSNQLWALSGASGASRWVYSPGDLDIVNGGVLVDNPTNRVWLTSRSGGSTPSLRVIDSVGNADGGLPAPGSLATLADGGVAAFRLGDIDNAAVKNYVSNEAYVVTNTGVAYGYNLNTMEQVWTYTIGGATSGYLVPMGTGFLVSVAGAVRRFNVDPATHVVSPMWTSPAITNPSMPRVDSVNSKVYVGDSAGRLHRLNLATGVEEKAITVSTQGLGVPAIDAYSTPNRIYVGGVDGRLCSVDLPF